MNNEAEKRKRGRPPGTVKPEEEQKDRRTVRMTDELWQHCQRQPGGASEYIRKLIEADRAQKG